MTARSSPSTKPALANSSGPDGGPLASDSNTVQTHTPTPGEMKLEKTVNANGSDRQSSNTFTAVARRGILSLKKKKPPVRTGYYGPPKCSIGTMFKSRLKWKDCSAAGVHLPNIAGISCSTNFSKKDSDPGTFSIVLNGGYEDDVDDGYTIYYTGAGGQSSSFGHTGSQAEDQSIQHYFNHALRLNINSGNPVRVVRGFKNQSKWAPREGYRYDGLYEVVKYKITTGKSGHQICLFQLQRLPNQRPLEDLSKYFH